MASITLDVRDYHERGEEPFAVIMQSAEKVNPGEDFILINSFEPHPLYRVLGSKGFTHASEETEPGTWRITFHRQG